jgi:hypothetical protein
MLQHKAAFKKEAAGKKKNNNKIIILNTKTGTNIISKSSTV